MALRSGYKGFKKLLGLKMIRPGTLTVDDTVLSNTFFPRSEQAVLGAVNLFNNTATTDTVGGIECTVNADKTVTASGTYSGGTYVQFSLGRVSVKKGWILKGCPSGGSTSTYQLILFNSAQSARLATDLGEGAVISADDSNALLAIYFHASVTDKVFKPQICLSMDTPYAPFAMTNRQLTDFVTPELGTVTSEFTLNAVSRLYKIGKVVIANILIDGITIDSFTDGICVLPEGYRPLAFTTFDGVADNNIPCRISVSPDGNVQSAVALTNNRLTINAVWITS